jgi:uncharacterized membrane protein HdeD (DUF308 family)
MIKKLVYRLMRQRHFWRGLSFSELSELYASSMLRMLAISLLMVFVPYYLYQQGYSITAIFVTFGSFFMARAVSDIAAGYTVARFGPKHTMIIACMLQMISAVCFLTTPAYHWPSWLLGVPWGMSASFYFIAFHVEFSKIKHLRHAGKEIGYMHIMEKIGAIIGPLAGGLAGAILGPAYIFVIATLVLFCSLWPLFRTTEPVRTHQQLNFKRFPVHKVIPDLRAYAALGVENTLCINLWPLYLGLFALQGSVYIQLGGLTSAAVLASIASAYTIGRLIDIRSGRKILRISVTLNALIYLFRPFVHSLMPALAVNLANEAITAGYRMPFVKGMYAAADDLPGFRIIYIVSMECIASIAKATVWLMLAVMAQALSAYAVILVGFMVAATASLLIMVERFRVLQPRSTIKGALHG